MNGAAKKFPAGGTELSRADEDYPLMDRKDLQAKIIELRDAAEQARALSVDLSDPKAEQESLELARKLEEEADALERKVGRKKEETK
jgi:hypothetical protein